MSVSLNKGWDSFAKRVAAVEKKAAADNAHVNVGVLGDADLAVIAAVQEYGSPAKNIPARPFMRKALHNPRLAKQVATIAARYYTDKLTLREALALIGTFGVAAVQQSIGSNIPPPNAPATVAAKGSSRTLVDTGRLRQSISYEIEK